VPGSKPKRFAEFFGPKTKMPYSYEWGIC